MFAITQAGGTKPLEFRVYNLLVYSDLTAGEDLLRLGSSVRLNCHEFLVLPRKGFSMST